MTCMMCPTTGFGPCLEDPLWSDPRGVCRAGGARTGVEKAGWFRMHGWLAAGGGFLGGQADPSSVRQDNVCTWELEAEAKGAALRKQTALHQAHGMHPVKEGFNLGLSLFICKWGII